MKDQADKELYNAAQAGDLKAVEAALAKGADIETNKVNSNCTPLSAACYYNKTEVAKYLLSKGAKVNADCYYTPLYGAAYSGSKELVELLVGKGADIEKVSGGYTPLSAACYYNKTEVAKYLLSKGAKVNVDCSYTPLYGAAQAGNKELVELLVNKGADIEKVSNGYTPLSIACYSSEFEIAKYLIDKGAKVNVDCRYTPLYGAAYSGSMELVELLIGKGVDIETSKVNGNYTPLSVACYYNKTEVAKYLLSKGAKVNVDCYYTPLYGAASRGNKELVELLVGKDADIEKVSNNYTPLSIACQYGQVEVAKYLLSKGAKVNADCRYTPLYSASYYGHMELVEMLLASGADTKLKVDAKTVLEHMEASGACNAKLKPLIRKLFALADRVDGALASGDKEQVKAVISAATSPMVIKRLYAQQAQNALGAKVDLEQNIWPELLAEKDSKLRAEVIEQFKKSGYQQLSHVAAAVGSMGIVQELLGGDDSGANSNSYSELNKLGKAGHSLLHIACKSGNLELAKYLINRGIKLSATNEAGLPELALVQEKGYLGIEELLKKTILVDQALLGNSSEAVEQIVKDKSLIELLCQRFSILDKFAAGQIKLDLVKHKGILVQHLGKAELLELWPKLAKMIEAERHAELFEAAEKGDIEQIKLLVAIGVSPHTLGKDERSVLYIGANKNYVELVKYCLSKEVGVDVEIGRKKVTPLHIASSRGNIEIVKLLLAAGADKTKEDEQGRSAAKLASNNGHKAVVELLESGKIEVADKTKAIAEAAAKTVVKLEPVAAKPKPEAASQVAPELELQPKSKPVLATKLSQKVEASSSELEIAAQASKLISEGSDKITGGQKQGILLLGNTGAGKSSLTYYLAGKQLVAELDDETGELLVKAKEQVSDIVIGHRARSETKVPNKLLLSAASEAIDGDGAVKEMAGVKRGFGGEGELAIWDCPGFKDTSVAQAVANGFFIKKLHQQHKELKFVLVATEGSIYGSRGTEFVEVLEQFCRSFQSIEHVQDSVYLVVSRAGAGRQSKHIAAKLSQIRAENPSLSEAAKQMLDYLVSDKSDKASTSSKSDKSSKSKIGLFYAPNKVGAMLVDAKLLASIESDSGYVDTAKETGRIAVSEESKKICSILMQQSYNNLHEIMDILQQAVIEPSELIQETGEGNVFVKHLDKIEGLLPKKLYDQRTKELATHSKGEYGIEIELLQKLKRQCTKVVEYGKVSKDSKDSKVSKGSKGNKDISKYSSVEEIVARALGILEILEEYALAGKDGAVELREVIYKYSHALKHQLGYCQILGEIAGLEQLLTVEGLSSYMQSIEEHIALAYHLQLSNMELATEQSELEVEGVSDAAGDASKDPANDPAYYKQMLSYLTNYQLEQQAAKKPVPAKCISNISKCYAELGKLSISKGVSDYQQAIEYYAKSLEYVEDYTIYDQLGDLLASLGQWQLAAKCYVVSENHWQLRECSKQLVAKIEAKQLDQATASKLCVEIADNWYSLGKFSKAQKYYEYAKSKAVGKTETIELNSRITSCFDKSKIADWEAAYVARKSKDKLVEQYDYTLLPMSQLKHQLEAAAAILAKSSSGLSASGYELLSEELTSSEEMLNGSSGKTELLLANKEEHLIKASIAELIPYETELGSESWSGAITTMGAMAEL